MKKRIWSLLLCLVLVCSSFAGCGKDESKEGEGSKTAPEKYVTEKFADLADSVTEALKSNMNAVPEANSNDGAGMDINLSVSVGEQIAAAYGLTGLETVSLLLSYDMKAGMQAIAELLLNGNSVLEANVYADEEAFYVNLPKYSKDYMKVTMEEILGMSIDDFASQITSSTEGTPTADEMAEIWSKYSKKFIDSFKYELMVENVTAGTGDYTFSADKYVASATVEDLQAVVDELAEELKKYSSLDVEKVDFSDVSNEKLYCHYYEGKDGEYEWKFSDDKEGAESIALAVTKKGFCLYGETAGKTEFYLYSVKESDSKGKIVLVDSGDEYTINYDNYSEDSIDLSGEIDGVEFTVSIEEKDNSFYADFSVSTFGIAVSGKLESDSNKVNITASVSYQGINFGTAAIECKIRDYADFTIPANSVDQNTWSYGLDQEALMTDLQQLMIDYPFLAELLMGASGLQ